MAPTSPEPIIAPTFKTSEMQGCPETSAEPADSEIADRTQNSSAGSNLGGRGRASVSESLDNDLKDEGDTESDSGTEDCTSLSNNPINDLIASVKIFEGTHLEKCEIAETLKQKLMAKEAELEQLKMLNKGLQETISHLVTAMPSTESSVSVSCAVNSRSAVDVGSALLCGVQRGGSPLEIASLRGTDSSLVQHSGTNKSLSQLGFGMKRENYDEVSPSRVDNNGLVDYSLAQNPSEDPYVRRRRENLFEMFPSSPRAYNSMDLDPTFPLVHNLGLRGPLDVNSEQYLNSGESMLLSTRSVHTLQTLQALQSTASFGPGRHEEGSSSDSRGSNGCNNCEVCGAGFPTRRCLKKHMSRLHSGQTKECDECGKKFRWDSDLKRHLQTHTGEKPFRCLFCHRGFTRKHRLDGHIQQKHAGEVPPDNDSQFAAGEHFMAGLWAETARSASTAGPSVDPGDAPVGERDHPR